MDEAGTLCARGSKEAACSATGSEGADFADAVGAAEAAGGASGGGGSSLGGNSIRGRVVVSRSGLNTRAVVTTSSSSSIAGLGS